MIYTKALHKKVINANSSEEIASADGNGPFATNAAGCADGNYGMYVNMQAPASRANCTAELSRHRGCLPWHCPALPGPQARGSRGVQEELKTGFGIPRPISLASAELHIVLKWSLGANHTSSNLLVGQGYCMALWKNQYVLGPPCMPSTVPLALNVFSCLIFKRPWWVDIIIIIITTTILQMGKLRFGEIK